MGIKSKLKDWFDLNNDYNDMYEEDFSSNMVQEQDKSKQTIVSLKSIQQSSKVILMEPRVFNDAQTIADHLKNRRAVVVNLQRMETEHARRIVDFLSGTVYAINGDIQKVGTQTFLCVPDNVEVAGSISEGFVTDENHVKRW
ncbi:cell division protein SepF [Fervidibacillus halotolerans]|uniref:Cell division protein SepF n=1 Tax=Fervidibacillus halotolerans TaxID=2980027 RepID=A0A9E8M1S2_9BACI|nr:cell division protein SepF [Fervidibacillus halotolerans]WAA13669.1 cell division protein SepF [Fervidibacillus halotolerans]